MAQSIHDILAYFREEAFHNRDLGDKFKRPVAGYLTKYADLFGGKVWLWTEWPQHKIQNTGIDLVAEEMANGQRTLQSRLASAPTHNGSMFSVSEETI